MTGKKSGKESEKSSSSLAVEEADNPEMSLVAQLANAVVKDEKKKGIKARRKGKATKKISKNTKFNIFILFIPVWV